MMYTRTVKDVICSLKATIKDYAMLKRVAQKEAVKCVWMLTAEKT